MWCGSHEVWLLLWNGRLGLYALRVVGPVSPWTDIRVTVNTFWTLKFKYEISLICICFNPNLRSFHISNLICWISNLLWWCIVVHILSGSFSVSNSCTSPIHLFDVSQNLHTFSCFIYGLDVFYFLHICSFTYHTLIPYMCFCWTYVLRKAS